MSEKSAVDGTTALDASLASAKRQVTDDVTRPSFVRRYRLPILLAVVAVCLYAGSILYILYGRGQIA